MHIQFVQVFLPFRRRSGLLPGQRRRFLSVSMPASLPMIAISAVDFCGASAPS
jgi:hypothetical protein